MASRLELHELLCEILGSRNVYFQPPESTKLNFPAIIYSRSNIDNVAADDRPYFQKYFYQVIVVDKDPDSEVVERVSQMKCIRFNNHYASDNLNHDVFTLYF